MTWSPVEQVERMAAASAACPEENATATKLVENVRIAHGSTESYGIFTVFGSIKFGQHRLQMIPCWI